MRWRDLCFVLGVVGAILILVVGLATPTPAEAIPPFAQRHEMSCGSCHEGHYPRLNAFGRQFRDNGYQLPSGAEDFARSERNAEPADSHLLSVFKELPIAVRGEVFTVVPTAPEKTEQPTYSHSLYAFLIGGGTVSKDVSYMFTWTPFPEPALHQARIGFHNVLDEQLGAGTLNVRVGKMFLLDFQRPSHRFLAPGAEDLESVAVGNNTFTFSEASLGVQIYGRPAWGPFHYEVALVQGNAPNDLEIDDWKDVFARSSVTLFQNSDHEVTPGAFVYRGRSDTVALLGDLVLAQRDDFWIAGGDLEVDLGRFNLSSMVLASRHSDPAYDGQPQSYQGGRVELLWVPLAQVVTSVRYEQVWSGNDDLRRQNLAPHLTWVIRPNVLLTGSWRHDLADFQQSSAVLVLDTTF